MHGWRDADDDRMERLRLLHAQSRSNVRGHAPIDREPAPTPAPHATDGRVQNGGA
jgi:hypothetical protein